MSNRKAFNFYKSYYDVSMELNDKDFVAFIKALLKKQFEGVEPNDLSGMAKFCYMSQKHSIDSQVAGYETKTKVKLTPMEGASVGGSKGASVQEKEKEKEQDVLPKNTKKVIKISFEESDLFDKDNFVKNFPTWQREKLRHYYDAALRYSVEGNKYVSWQLAIQTWERKDAGKGMTYAPIIEEMTQAEINKQKERDFYARL